MPPRIVPARRHGVQLTINWTGRPRVIVITPRDVPPIPPSLFVRPSLTVHSMRLARAALALCSAYSVAASALTAVLSSNERSCYYADVDGVGEKIGEPECMFVR